MTELINWWQNLPSQIDPVAFNLGPIPIRWYGLMYIAAFLTAYLLIRYRIKSDPPILKMPSKKLLETIDNLFLWGLIGVLVGGRLGYIIFYSTSTIWTNPLSIIWPFTNGSFVGIAGMSFHGGLIGAAIAFIIFTKKYNYKLWSITDLLLPAVPLGYTFGRIGNWLNGELWGRVTNSAIGQYFAQAPSNQLRHPSQLYEALGEGIILFLIIWPLRNKLKPGQISGLFLVGYALARIIVEFFREPDAHIGFIAGPFSLGQILSGLMLIIGVFIFYKNRTKQSS